MHHVPHITSYEAIKPGGKPILATGGAHRYKKNCSMEKELEDLAYKMQAKTHTECQVCKQNFPFLSQLQRHKSTRKHKRLCAIKEATSKRRRTEGIGVYH